MSPERAQDRPNREDLHPVLATLFELGGAGVLVSDPANSEEASSAAPGVVRIGVHRSGPLPHESLKPFDILLSSDPAAVRPWVGLAPDRLDVAISDLRAGVEQQPAAAAVVAQVLRMTLQLSFDQALVLESLGYSLLLAAEGFRRWRSDTPVRERPDPGRRRVQVNHEARLIQIRLDRPDSRNAFDARMRDELVEALETAALDPDEGPVVLSGRGPVFSAGGDLDEFGRADDVGRAHLIRTHRSPARLVHALGGRLTARVHGACIGAGVEVPAAAARVIAAPETIFRLPEVSMGLIPGAGGTATIPRRIGRRRACYMAVSGADIDARTALAWGLVDEVEQVC